MSNIKCHVFFLRGALADIRIKRGVLNALHYRMMKKASTGEAVCIYLRFSLTKHEMTCRVM